MTQSDKDWNPETGAVRSFCRRSGTPLIYERTRSRHMVNVSRALFQSRTGHQPIYHIAIEEMQDWAYAGEPLVPLKGYPGAFSQPGCGFVLWFEKVACPPHRPSYLLAPLAT